MCTVLPSASGPGRLCMIANTKCYVKVGRGTRLLWRRRDSLSCPILLTLRNSAPSTFPTPFHLHSSPSHPEPWTEARRGLALASRFRRTQHTRCYTQCSRSLLERLHQKKKSTAQPWAQDVNTRVWCRWQVPTSRAECIYTYTSFEVHAHVHTYTLKQVCLYGTYSIQTCQCALRLVAMHVHPYPHLSYKYLPRGAGPACGAFGTHNSTNYLADFLESQRPGRFTTYTLQERLSERAANYHAVLRTAEDTRTCHSDTRLRS